MKVTEHLAKGQSISFEIIPPKRGGNVDMLEETVRRLTKYNPPFIDVTSHSAQVDYIETPNGISRKIRRKRPGTMGICALIQHKYRIDAVPHVLCKGFTQQETEDFLIEVHYNRIQNVLALQGDDNGYQKAVSKDRTANKHAVDLVTQISRLNKGKYLDEDLLDVEPTHFCIGVVGYPEKHFEAPNMETDILRLKDKVDAGAEYVVTQMFFDNEKYFSYVKLCREAGIDVPIIPGLKVLTSKKHMKSIPGTFHINIPYALSSEMEKSKPEHVTDISVEWAVSQVHGLLAGGAPAVHFFIMQDIGTVELIMNKLGY